MAYFVVMMKGCQYDSRFLRRHLNPHVYAIQESGELPQTAFGYCGPEEPTARTLWDTFRNAKEYGSILQPKVTLEELDKLEARLQEADSMAGYGSLGVQGLTYQLLDVMYPLIDQARMLVQKYDVVVTNPPYMGSSGMNARLSDFVKQNYPDTKSDMSTVCMERTINMCNAHGYMAMINIPVWMFLSSYEKLREKMLRENTIVSMVHPGRGIFGSDFGTTAFVIAKVHLQGYKGHYRRLFDKQGEVESVEQREQRFFEKRGVFYATQDNFSKIPGSPVAYWVRNEKLFKVGTPLEQIANPRQGMKTLDNDKFIRIWHEIEIEKAKFDCTSFEEAKVSGAKWFPLNHGGEFRKYYGNNFELVNWENDGFEMKSLAIKKYNSITRTITNLNSYFKEGITWTVISSASTSFRRYGKGFMFSNSGQCIVPVTPELLDYLTGLLNSKIVRYILSILSPTLGFESGYLKKIPIRIDAERRTNVEELTRANIGKEKSDWDSFETSWDFKRHPLV